jgi:hypothetical protein
MRDTLTALCSAVAQNCMQVSVQLHANYLACHSPPTSCNAAPRRPAASVRPGPPAVATACDAPMYKLLEAQQFCVHAMQWATVLHALDHAMPANSTVNHCKRKACCSNVEPSALARRAIRIAAAPPRKPLSCGACRVHCTQPEYAEWKLAVLAARRARWCGGSAASYPACSASCSSACRAAAPWKTPLLLAAAAAPP